MIDNLNIIEQIVENHEQDNTILIVMHGGPISCLVYDVQNTILCYPE